MNVFLFSIASGVLANTSLFFFLVVSRVFVLDNPSFVFRSKSCLCFRCDLNFDVFNVKATNYVQIVHFPPAFSVQVKSFQISLRALCSVNHFFQHLNFMHIVTVSECDDNLYIYVMVYRMLIYIITFQ